ncbi:hypothetical protein SRHO_G00245370 [Serrasalmus rhombeus]
MKRVSDFCPVPHTHSRAEERASMRVSQCLRFLNGYHCSGVSRARGAVSLALCLGVSDGLAPRWTRPSRALSAPLGPVCCVTAQRTPKAKGLAFLIQP